MLPIGSNVKYIGECYLRKVAAFQENNDQVVRPPEEMTPEEFLGVIHKRGIDFGSFLEVMSQLGWKFERPIEAAMEATSGTI